MHGELCALEAKVRVLPFVTQHLRAALLHPAGMGAVGAVAEVLGVGFVVSWVSNGWLGAETGGRVATIVAADAGPGR